MIADVASYAIAGIGVIHALGRLFVRKGFTAGVFWRHLSKFMSEFHGVSCRFGRMFGRSPTIATFFPRLK